MHFRHIDPALLLAFAGIVGILIVGSLAGWILRLRARTESAIGTASNFNERVRAWWLIYAVFALAYAFGKIGAVVLFACVSLLALREFVTLLPTTRADHRTLVWSFYVITPLQYYLIVDGWYDLFAIFILVYVFLFVPISLILRGRTDRFLDRSAEIQWALMICVYCVSYAPALLLLHSFDPPYGGAKLLLFLVVVVQLGDVFQYCWGKLLGKRPLAPHISPNKTWEGLIGGVASATLLGAALWWLTPYTPLIAAAMSLVITVIGTAGGLTMSAIKRDRGVKDFGTMLPGHGGMLDRVDSICFAAPILFHLTRFFYG